MFGKLSKHHFHSLCSNTKRHIGTAYAQAKHILGNIDHGINVGRTVFSVLQPYIEQLGQNHINRHCYESVNLLGRY